MGGAMRRPEMTNLSMRDRGFASMDRAKQREIASRGGKAAHAAGTAHTWTSAEAREAGRKGGLIPRVRKAAPAVPLAEGVGTTECGEA